MRTGAACLPAAGKAAPLQGKDAAFGLGALKRRPYNSAPTTRLLWWFLWGEVEVLVIEAEVGEGGDGNHCEVIDVAGWI